MQATAAAKEKSEETAKKLSDIDTVQEHYAFQISKIQTLLNSAKRRARSIRGQQHRLDAEVRRWGVACQLAR